MDSALLLEAALAYAAKGWRVHPLRLDGPSAGKAPLWREWVQTATADPVNLSEVLAGLEANLGIVTGAESGLAVLDLDPKTGTAEDLLLELEQLVGESCPAGAVCVTGSGGLHLYFADPEGRAGRNGSWARSAGGVDLRAEGGQVVAPPSLHCKTGNLYRWQDEDPETGLLPLLEPAPVEWLLRVLERLRGKPAVQRSQETTTAKWDPPALEDLAQALQLLEQLALQRDSWVKVGLCLKGCYGDAARSLWLRWSCAWTPPASAERELLQSAERIASRRVANLADAVAVLAGNEWDRGMQRVNPGQSVEYAWGLVQQARDAGWTGAPAAPWAARAKTAAPPEWAEVPPPEDEWGPPSAAVRGDSAERTAAKTEAQEQARARLEAEAAGRAALQEQLRLRAVALGGEKAPEPFWVTADEATPQLLHDRKTGRLPWFPLGDPAVLAAAPGTGKSLLATRLATAVITGGEWLSAAVPAEAQGAVVWLAAEEPAKTLRRRLWWAALEQVRAARIHAYCEAARRYAGAVVAKGAQAVTVLQLRAAAEAAWTETHTVTDAMRAEAQVLAELVRSRLWLVVLPDTAAAGEKLAAVCDITIERGGERERRRITRPQDLQTVLEGLVLEGIRDGSQVVPVRLVVADPFAELLELDSENDNAQVSAGIRATIHKLVKADERSVLVIDHVSKGSQGTGLERIRGASAKAASYRWAGLLEKTNQQDREDPEALLEILKCSNGVEWRCRLWKFGWTIPETGPTMAAQYHVLPWYLWRILKAGWGLELPALDQQARLRGWCEALAATLPEGSLLPLSLAAPHLRTAWSEATTAERKALRKVLELELPESNKDAGDGKGAATDTRAGGAAVQAAARPRDDEDPEDDPEDGGGL